MVDGKKTWPFPSTIHQPPFTRIGDSMYVYLLWVRYLKTRRLAFICMGSVMLGVATLIVVNSVMSGFSSKLTQRLHDMQSDIVIESIDTMGGFEMPAEEMMARIRS